MYTLLKFLRHPSSVVNLIDIIKLYKDWPIYILDVFQILKGKERTLRLRNGVCFRFRPRTRDLSVINEIIVHQCYFFKDINLKDATVCIDVGSHIGVFAVYAATLMQKGRVLAFEPLPENFEMLKKNVRLNRQKTVSCFAEGIDEKEGTMSLYLPENPLDTISVSLYHKTSNERKVRITTLEKIFIREGLTHCDFLKLDCEGSEFSIIFSLPLDMLQGIKMIAGEYHEHKRIDELKSYLEQHHFQVHLPSQVPGFFYAKNSIFKKFGKKG